MNNRYTITIDYDTQTVILHPEGVHPITMSGLVRGVKKMEQGVHEALVQIHGEHPPFQVGDIVHHERIPQEDFEVLDIRQRGLKDKDWHPADTRRWEVNLAPSERHEGGWYEAAFYFKESPAS